MKKIVSLCLALALVMSLGITAFANETDVGLGDYSTAVTGSTVNSTTGGTVFSVDITWSDMDFIYHGAQAPVWDAENHTYTEGAAAYWEGWGHIKVANNSNAGITATPSYTAAAGYEDATMRFDTDKLCVGTAEFGEQRANAIYVTPTGSLPNDTQDKTIGTITITIAENTEIAMEDVQALSSAVSRLISEIESSELYASNAELQQKAESLSNKRTDIDWFTCEIDMGTYSQSEIASRYDNYRTWYYEELAYFNNLKNA